MGLVASARKVRSFGGHQSLDRRSPAVGPDHSVDRSLRRHDSEGTVRARPIGGSMASAATGAACTVSADNEPQFTSIVNGGFVLRSAPTTSSWLVPHAPRTNRALESERYEQFHTMSPFKTPRPITRAHDVGRGRSPRTANDRDPGADGIAVHLPQLMLRPMA
jgi:hypothetical protein